MKQTLLFLTAFASLTIDGKYTTEEVDEMLAEIPTAKSRTRTNTTFALSRRIEIKYSKTEKARWIDPRSLFSEGERKRITALTRVWHLRRYGRCIKKRSKSELP
jgi:hypothetical protein